MNEQNFIKAIAELKKLDSENFKQTKFDETLDLIINLKEFNLKKTPINYLISLPHKVKDKIIAGFFEKKSESVYTVTKAEFPRYENKKDLKKLVKKYDFFIANGKLMPAVATTFGRALGPVGKMPSPQMGILIKEDETTIKDLVKKLENIVKIRPKEPSIKIPVGRKSQKESELLDNIAFAYGEIFKNLPRQKENIKNVLIKFTMSKPVKVQI